MEIGIPAATPLSARSHACAGEIESFARRTHLVRGGGSTVYRPVRVRVPVNSQLRPRRKEQFDS